DRILVVGVDGHPFRALRLRVDGVQAERQFSSQMSAQRLQAQSWKWLPVARLWPEVVVSARIRMWLEGLQRICPAVNEKSIKLSGHLDCRVPVMLHYHASLVCIKH